MYPNQPCPDCPEDSNDIPLPSPCGSECAAVYDALCVNYTGTSIDCSGTPIVTTNSSINSVIESMATQICNGVTGIAATFTLGNITVNSIAYDATASGTMTNSGTSNAAIIDLTLNLPAGVPADAVNIKADSTDTETISTGSKTITFIAPLVGPYIWDIGTRIRLFYDSTNYMEGLVTAHSASDVTVIIDYVVGSGTFSTWEVIITGDVGSQGVAGTITVNSPATVNQVVSTAPAVVTITNLGTPENALLDFTFDIPAGNGVASAAVNGSGELELTLDDATVLNAGPILSFGAMPIGGVAGAVLTKDSGASYDVSWSLPDTSGWMPTGGTANQLLVKQSGTNYDAVWVSDVYLAPVPSTLATGEPTPVIHVRSETELANAITEYNDQQSNRYGAIIYLAQNILITQNHTFPMGGIEIRGNGDTSLIMESATSPGTFYTITCNYGNPVIKDVNFTALTLIPNSGGVNPTFFEINSLYKVTVQFINCAFENIAYADSATNSNILLTLGDVESELILDNCSIISGLAVDAGTPTTNIKMAIESTAWDGSVTIKNMRFTRATEKGSGTHNATTTPTLSEYVSSIYFKFIGTWATAAHNILNIDMESYAYSELNNHFGTNDSGNVYILNSMFMYGDDDNTQVSLKPNGFGKFGWNNPSATHPLDDTTYA